MTADGFLHKSVTFLFVGGCGALELEFDLLAHELEDLELVELAPGVFVAVARDREKTLQVLLAKGHRAVLGVALIATTFLLSL